MSEPHEHDWYWQVDWYGDAEVPGGTADCSSWRCRTCGAEDTERAPPDDEDDA